MAKSTSRNRRQPDQGLRVALLPDDEGREPERRQQRKPDRKRTAERPGVDGEGQQKRAEPGDQQHGADAIEPAHRALLRGGRNEPGQRQSRQHDRRARPEHGGPAELLDQDTAHERPQRRASRRDGRVDAEHAGARALLEQRDRQRRSATQRQGYADALQHAAEQQERVGRRGRAGSETKGADQQPELEDAPISQQVADPTEHEHQAGIGQNVGDHDPADVLHLQAEGLRDAREGDVDGGVEGRGYGAEADDR